MRVRQVGGAGGSDPLLQEAAVVCLRDQQRREGADEACQGGHLGAGGGEAGENFQLAGGEAGGLGEQDADRAAG